jgi:Flp pilus assembly secretin CpaC
MARPFKNVILGNPDVVDVVQGQTNQELIVSTKPDGGATNIALIDEHGEQVANVLVTTAPKYQPARSAVTGRLQVYRNDDKCYPDCTKPNARRADEKGK